MAKKKLSKTKKQTPEAKDIAPQAIGEQGDKIINSMVNTSVLLMSILMGAFGQVLVKATGAMAGGMAEAFGGKEAGDNVNQEINRKLPEVDEKMKTMISDMRKDIYFQMRQKKQEIEPLLSDPIFGVGPKIIEKYDFKLPKLTKELDDNTLAQYAQLLISEDIQFTEMFKELTEWINSLPKPEEKKKAE
jgi:hypothetical protein